MAATDPRTPAIVGAAQLIQRPGDRDPPLGPIELMTEVARRAAADAGSNRLLERIGWVGVAGGYWSYRNPGQLVADALGCRGAGTALGAISGSAPQEMMGLAARRVADGELDVALMVGGEARYTSVQLKRAGEQPPWDLRPGEGTPEVVDGYPADDHDLHHEYQLFGMAATAYALMSDSMRAACGETVDEHRSRLATVWAGFSRVAAENPYAWDRTAHSVAAIRDERPDNRMIAFPYPKAMVANNDVDMASAVLLCSVGVARELGVAPDRLVFPHTVATAHETWLLAARDVLHEAPALQVAGRRALRGAGIEPGEVTHVDLYGCFPAIVEMSAEALGFSTDRPLTVTGGLGFAGAPVGNAAGQSMAAMVPLLRAGGCGVVQGNGAYATTHAFGVYADHPPDRFVFDDCQPEVVSRPRPVLPDDWVGPAAVEAATVVYGKDRVGRVVAALRPTGRDHESRGWGTSDHADLVERIRSEGLVGAIVTRRADRTIV